MTAVMFHRIARPRRHGGFSLIELMVSLAIGLVLTLAITVLLTRNEAGRRGLNASNDMEQTGAYLSLQLDRSLRSAGSGFVHGWRTAFGCQVFAARDDVDILPLAEALAAPFDSMPTTVRMAPVVIHEGAAGAGGDVLAIMAGAGGLGEATLTIQPGSVEDDKLRLPNTLGMRENDLVMLSHSALGCMVQQADDGFVGSSGQQLPLGGSYYKTTIDSRNLSDFGSQSGPLLMQLGNPAGAPPQWVWLGVGANETLLSYDLLQIDGGTAPRAVAEGVTVMRALYGVDTDGDGKLDEWHSPDEDDYLADDTAGHLLDGSTAAAARLRGIVAIRVALVLSSTLVERDSVPTAQSLTLFGDLGDLAIDVDFSARDDADTQAKRRHRVFEFTVPLRNALI